MRIHDPLPHLYHWVQVRQCSKDIGHCAQPTMDRPFRSVHLRIRGKWLSEADPEDPATHDALRQSWRLASGPNVSAVQQMIPLQLDQLVRHGEMHFDSKELKQWWKQLEQGRMPATDVLWCFIGGSDVAAMAVREFNQVMESQCLTTLSSQEITGLIGTVARLTAKESAQLWHTLRQWARVPMTEEDTRDLRLGMLLQAWRHWWHGGFAEDPVVAKVMQGYASGPAFAHPNVLLYCKLL